MVSISHAISMPEKTWEQIETRINKLKFSRSGYLQLLAEKDLNKKKVDCRFIDIVILCVLSVFALLLVLVML